MTQRFNAFDVVLSGVDFDNMGESDMGNFLQDFLMAIFIFNYNNLTEPERLFDIPL